jgi:ribokinase
MDSTSLIVIGMLNTDIFAHVSHFPRPNDPVYGGRLQIGPGGKPGNIARMAGLLMPANSVAMIGRTVKDSYNLWKEPVDGLEAAGVNTDYIKILDDAQTDKLPSVALGGVDKDGNNLFFVLPGVSEDFSIEDIDDARPIFESAANNSGFLALTLECPLVTTIRAVDIAGELGIKVAFDPGGITEDTDITKILKANPYIVKPNEFEAEHITGIKVTDFNSASEAADRLKELGAQNVLITHGENGAYLFGGEASEHIPIPDVEGGEQRDATGCGDQALATLCAHLQAGKTLQVAAKAAVLAGTLQFYKAGCQPLTREELGYNGDHD